MLVMISQLPALIAIFIAITIKSHIVQGLQCYVCDVCNEYEDLTELETCGAISVITTQRPSTIPVTQPTNAVTMMNTGPTTIMPPQSGIATTSNQQVVVVDTNRTETMVVATTIPTTVIGQNMMGQETTIAPTIGPNMMGQETTAAPTIGPTTLPNAGAETTAAPNTVTTLGPVQQPIDYDYMEYEDPKIVAWNRLSRADDGDQVATLSPAEQSFNYDYLEYEDTTVNEWNGSARASASGPSLTVNKPVCYMYRYHANNTIFTKRGCTMSINDNPYLTCQSLYTGQPISGCRICSSDGCNKYADDESDDDHQYSGGILRQFSLMRTFLSLLVARMVA